AVEPVRCSFPLAPLFARVDSAFAEVAATRGLRLGLAIIRRLAALLHHEVEFDSASGRGSRFSILVPRAMPDDAAQSAAPALASSSPTFGGALIAVIDDELTVVEGMHAWLAQSGAVVVGAGTGKDMLAALGEHGR
ncbi:MAG TPA: hypothetical protein VHJ55_06730, partial [Casimicrobiaceae bacterium]|nr:hypothetical protein [Casimicrobiaceae bacterium]